MNVNVTGDSITQEEINEYIKYGKKKYPTGHITGIDINVDGDYVDLKFHLSPSKFERIRRITGYLVGTTERFNDAKRSEEHDRVKHTI